MQKQQTKIKKLTDENINFENLLSKVVIKIPTAALKKESQD